MELMEPLVQRLFQIILDENEILLKTNHKAVQNAWEAANPDASQSDFSFVGNGGSDVLLAL